MEAWKFVHSSVTEFLSKHHNAHLFRQIIVQTRLPASVAGHQALLNWEGQLEILEPKLLVFRDRIDGDEIPG